ncbi:UDP-N-acetylmuramoyl-tripeptide--D-alanyl-D-alanine ligase [Bizionia sp. KMM 8389]
MDLQLLHQHFLDCESVCTDTRKITTNCMFFALKGANFNGNTFSEQALKEGAKFVIIDDKNYYKDKQTILVNNVLETLQALARYHREYLGIPIISLTGSNGKTTTKELINAVLSKKYKTSATFGNLNNHIGVPLTLLAMDKQTEIGIVEMGANHKKEIAFLCDIAHPDFGYITNFGKAHLEGFGGVEGVIKGKSELYTYLKAANKSIFVNADDAIQVTHTQNAQVISFGESSKNETLTIQFLEANPFVKLTYKDTQISSQLIGEYNFTNIAAAISIGNYFKVPTDAIKLAIENYVPTNNRSQIITRDSTKIILDAYNANPSSMKVALTHFSNQDAPNKIAILGDMFELGQEAKKEHQTIVDLACQLPIDKIYFLGENFNLTTSDNPKCSFFSSFKAFKDASNNLASNNTLILIKGSRGMALERILDIIN